MFGTTYYQRTSSSGPQKIKRKIGLTSTEKFADQMIWTIQTKFALTQTVFNFRPLYNEAA